MDIDKYIQTQETQGERSQRVAITTNYIQLLDRALVFAGLALGLVCLAHGLTGGRAVRVLVRRPRPRPGPRAARAAALTGVALALAAPSSAKARKPLSPQPLSGPWIKPPWVSATEFPPPRSVAET